MSKKRNRRIRKRLLFIAFSYFLIIFLFGWVGIHTIKPNKEETAAATPTPLPVLEAGTQKFISLDSLYSKHAILLSLKDQKIIAERKSEDRIYPASLTKIMTAVIIIEETENLNQLVTLSPDMFQDLYNAGASMAGFLPDEEATVKDLLYGVLLPSGAECCIGLADFLAGSEVDFVKLMNQKAADLGLEGTNFTNSTGLHDENHYSTVKDLATLLEYALKDDVFREIFTSERHSTQPTNKHPEGLTFYSTMFKNLNPALLKDGSILGGKTGYTEQAGLCLASLAKMDGNEYILVTAGAKGNHDTQQYNISDALKVYGSIRN